MATRRSLPVLLITLMLLAPIPSTAQEQVPPESGGGSAPGNPGQPVEPDPYLQLFEIRILDGGKEVQAAPAGREVTLRVGLYNPGPDAFKSVSAKLTESKGVRAVDATAEYGDIAPQGSASGDFTIIVDEQGCSDSFAIGLTATSGAKTFDLVVDAPAACPGPRLALVGFDFDDSSGDGDGVPEPGESVDLTLHLTNTGRDPAQNVLGTVMIKGTSVTPKSVTTSWPDIHSSETKTSLPIRMVIASDAPLQPACEGPQPLPAEPPPPVHGEPASGEPGTAEEPVTVSTVPPQSSESRNPDEPVTSEPGPPPGEQIAPGEPGPDAADLAALIEATVEITAQNYSTDFEFNNGLACAVMEIAAGPQASGAVAEDKAADETSGVSLPLVLGLTGIGAAAGIFLAFRWRARRS